MTALIDRSQAKAYPARRLAFVTAPATARHQPLRWLEEAVPGLTSISQMELAPKPGRAYHNFERECREEFIYFLMVDRFHDDKVRTPPTISGRSQGISTPNDFYGGKIKGITRNLDYI